MRGLKLMTMLCLLVLMAGTVEAKWWIFGSSDAGVSTRYIYLNDLSYDELGNEVTLYSENLQQGEVVIRGKGSAGKNKIGAVQVSLDGKQSWHKAKVASDGSFIYSFTPETGESHELFIKVMDTTGKTNDVEASRKVLTISDESVQDQVYLTLDKLIKAYQEEDSFAFMRLVSDDFVNGIDILDSAIRQDFSFFDNITLDYTINNITSARGGNLFVAISFNRMVTSSRSGETFSDKGVTEFIFKVEGNTPKIYIMKNPLIFGLSDASEVASGTVTTGLDEQVISVDNNGGITLKRIDELGSDETEGSTLPSGNITLRGNFSDGLIMSTGQVYNGSSSSAVDFYLETNILYSDSGAQYRLLGSIPIDDITSVPADGYMPINGIHFNVGDTYAIKLPDDTYGVFEVTDFVDIYPEYMGLVYKYQPNGSSNF